MRDVYGDLILALKKHGMKAELHQPDQLVVRYAHGFSSPGWLTWHEGWFACTWGPTCYRLPADTDLVAFCAAWREAPQGTGRELAGELVDRYGLEQVEYESLHWLGGYEE